MIDKKIFRAQFFVNFINGELEKRNISKTKLAENMGVSQPAVTPFLNMKRIGTDDFFHKMMLAIPLTETEIKKIFQEADKEEYKYKYGEDLGLDTLVIKDEGQEIVTTKEEAESVLFKKNGIDKPTDEDLLAIRIALDMAKKRREMKK